MWWSERNKFCRVVWFMSLHWAVPLGSQMFGITLILALRRKAGFAACSYPVSCCHGSLTEYCQRKSFGMSNFHIGFCLLPSCNLGVKNVQAYGLIPRWADQSTVHTQNRCWWYSLCHLWIGLPGRGVVFV